MNRRLFNRSLAVAALVGVAACSQDSRPNSSSLTAPTPDSAAARGNGTPSGAKLVFSFNLIGTPKEYNGGCGDGRRIFVERNSHAQLLIQDADNGWRIVNCNGTGGTQAVLNSDDLGTFVVYARILGKPGGKLDVCADVISDTEDLCALGEIHLTREGGQSKFNIQANSLFDAELEDILWELDTNQDFRIAQFRVYQVSEQ